MAVAHPGDPAAAAFERAGRARGLAWRSTDAEGAGAALAGLLPHDNKGLGRVAVAGIGAAGEEAVKVAAGDGRVTALLLVGAPLSTDAVALVSEWPELPVLAVADPADRPSLRGAVDAYLASSHQASDILVGPIEASPIEASPIETSPIETSPIETSPEQGSTVEWAVRWLGDRLAHTARVEEVTFTSVDGWELHGTRWLPDRPDPAPGVVLLHSGRSDRAVFARVERLLAERGLAVLNIDWRGRGQSNNLGTYFSLSAEEKAAGWRDAAAAAEHLAGCPGVDGERLGMVGVVHGAEHAARAALRDRRVRALVLLTGYRPDDEAEAAHLTSGHVDVLYVTSADHRVTTGAMRSLYEATSTRHTRYVEYPGGAIGYQLFELDHGLEGTVVAWLAEVLGG